MDEQVSFTLADYHLLLESVDHINAYDRVKRAITPASSARLKRSNHYHLRINRSAFYEAKPLGMLISS
jgi:hypothetical protein